MGLRNLPLATGLEYPVAHDGISINVAASHKSEIDQGSFV